MPRVRDRAVDDRARVGGLSTRRTGDVRRSAGSRRNGHRVAGRQAVRRDHRPAGLYRFAELTDGVWTLRVEMLGFEKISQDITVAPNTPPTMWELKLLSFETIAASVPPPPPAPPAPATPATPALRLQGKPDVRARRPQTLRATFSARPRTPRRRPRRPMRRRRRCGQRAGASPPPIRTAPPTGS